MKSIKMLTAIVALAGTLAVPASAGKVVLEGSTTVLPISQKAAEVYMKSHPEADLVVRGGGSGVGIASLIDGTCDIADASRAVKNSELDKAAKKKRTLKAHMVAMDGIAVIAHPSNTMTALTLAQIKDIYTGKTSNWSKVGGPDLKIVVVSRDSASGTFEAFGELALEKRRVRPDAVVQASNQGVASVVSRTPGAIGYVGLGYISQGVKAFEVEGVMPSKQSVLLNKYPISRPLFMYTNGVPQGDVKGFINFLKGPEGQKIVEEEGFVGLK
jgi:phosphate transport system substrate-binding protein